MSCGKFGVMEIARRCACYSRPRKRFLGKLLVMTFVAREYMSTFKTICVMLKAHNGFLFVVTGVLSIDMAA